MATYRIGCGIVMITILALAMAHPRPEATSALPTPPDSAVSLTLGPVTITTYNPVTVTALENSTNVYFVAKNQSTQSLTLQLTSWREILGDQPWWVAQVFKFVPGAEGPDDPTNIPLQPGETRTLNFYFSKDVNGAPPQQCQFPFRFRVAETGDQGAINITLIGDDSLQTNWAGTDHPSSTAWPLPSATITGQVTSVDGRPVAGVEITGARFNERLPSRTWTDANGRYSLGVLSMGDVRTIVGARPLPYRSLDYFVTAEAEGYGLAYQAGITPAAGQSLNVDLILPKASGLMSDARAGELPPERLPQKLELYRMVGQLKTDGLLAYWRMKFAGNGDRVVSVQGQHPPVNPMPGHIIAVDLTGRELWRVPTGDQCWGLDVSFDGSLVAAGCYDQFVYIVSSADGRVLQKLQIGDRPGGANVMGVRFSPDAKYLLTDGAGGPGGLSVLDVKTGQQLWTSHDLGVYNGRWTPDGKRVVSTDGETVEMFTADGIPLWKAQIGIGALWLEVDSAYNVYAAGKSRELFSFDKDGNLRWSYRLASTTQEATRGITSDGSFMLLPTMNGLLQAFSATGAVLWQHFPPGLWPTPGETAIYGPGHNATSMTPDGGLIAVGDRSFRLLLYDRKGTLLWRDRESMRPDFLGEDPLVHGSMTGTESVDISPDGKYIAAGYADSVIRIFERQAPRNRIPRTSPIKPVRRRDQTRR